MNAIAQPARAATPVAPHPTHKLKWLLKREFWEHKGGFLWAPLISGAVFLFFTLLGGGTGQVMFSRHGGKVVNFDGQEVPLSQVDWDRMLASASPDDLRQMGEAINGITLMSAFWPLVVFGFVVFFYLLGSLYDERRDRSVLFWKSMPVSDGMTVLSKVLTALLVAPAIAALIALAVMLAFGVIISLFIAFNGANPFTLYWANLEPLKLAGALFGWIPVYALWALPTAGWLMLCSAWARSKPFLWAVMVPILGGILVTWFGFFGNFRGDSEEWIWQHVVARMLTSAWPGSHLLGFAGTAYLDRLDDSPKALYGLDGVIGGLPLLATPALWIGAAAGVALILAAIRLRRWRDDA